ncbi:Gfo/Idh/MocA family protein [Plantactinospora sp. GCM10030261]|uniref:Gfo/Idh/MocA family protein n=1 Tax=Plantactinospora sp. GCM10030261 TaxID=3273420 RepID=UPI00361E2EA9
MEDTSNVAGASVSNTIINRARSTGIAFVGTGYVADFYQATLPNHPELQLIGVYDHDCGRAKNFSACHDVPTYSSLDALLADDRVALVVNLTNPDSHFDVSRRSLAAGRHVYSEKPFATTLAEAEELVTLADRHGLILGSAPCSLLGETAQTLWAALRSHTIGNPRLVYAEIDDGAIHRMPYHDWTSVAGTPWPYQDEFLNGPVLEHAAYYLTWLTAFFGPAREVTASAHLIVPDRPVPPERTPAADFACATIAFHSGVIARLTCGTVAPQNHTLQIVGDAGVLSIDRSWDYHAPVFFRPHRTATDGSHDYLTEPQIYPPVRVDAERHRYYDTHDMDFARGVAEVAAQAAGSPSRHMDARHALHVLEIVLAITASATGPARTAIRSTFDPIEPMPWATS